MTGGKLFSRFTIADLFSADAAAAPGIDVVVRPATDVPADPESPVPVSGVAGGGGETRTDGDLLMQEVEPTRPGLALDGTGASTAPVVAPIPSLS